MEEWAYRSRCVMMSVLLVDLLLSHHRYEGADAARRGLQAKTIAGAGPLKINASDEMQKFEDANPSVAAATWKADSILPKVILCLLLKRDILMTCQALQTRTRVWLAGHFSALTGEVCRWLWKGFFKTISEN